MTHTTQSKHTITLAPPFPQEGWVRLKQIVGDPKATPPVPAFIPVSKSTWWNWVNGGIAPKPIKLGEKTTVWKAEDIRQLAQGVA